LKPLVDTLVECGLLSGLVAAMERLDLSRVDEASGFYNSLSILENILELNPSLSTPLGKETRLFFLLTQYLNPFISSISLYCSEVLAVVLQESDENREYFGELGLIDNILNTIAPFRKQKASDSDLVEMVENLFDCLCSLLFLSSNKERFIQLEGIELCLECIRYQEQFRHAALRCLDFAVTNGPFIANRIIQLGGLGILFAMFCEKSKKSSFVLSIQDTEHIISIIYFLFQYSDEKHRLLKKFMENNYEKLKRLVELHKRYQNKVNAASQRENSELLRWEAGLYTLELIDIILAQLVVMQEEKNESNFIQVVWNLLRDNQIDIQTIKDNLKEFADNLQEEEEETTTTAPKRADVLNWIQEFGNKMDLFEK